VTGLKQDIAKISVSELHFFLNITTVIDKIYTFLYYYLIVDKIIIEKRMNYLVSDGKSSINHSNNITFLTFITLSPVSSLFS